MSRDQFSDRLKKMKKLRGDQKNIFLVKKKIFWETFLTKKKSVHPPRFTWPWSFFVSERLKFHVGGEKERETWGRGVGGRRVAKGKEVGGGHR